MYQAANGRNRWIHPPFFKDEQFNILICCALSETMGAISKWQGWGHTPPWFLVLGEYLCCGRMCHLALYFLFRHSKSGSSLRYQILEGGYQTGQVSSLILNILSI